MLNFKSRAVIHAVMIQNASMEIPWWSSDPVLLLQEAPGSITGQGTRFHTLHGAVKK